MFQVDFSKLLLNHSISFSGWSVFLCYHPDHAEHAV